MENGTEEAAVHVPPKPGFTSHSSGSSSVGGACYGLWPRAGPAVVMIEEPARGLPRVISVVPAAAGRRPWGSRCLLGTLSRVWRMVLLLSMTEGTRPRVSTGPFAGAVFSPLGPRARSPFMAASVEVRITVLEAVCRTGPTLEWTRLQEVVAGVEVTAKVTAPRGEEEEGGAATAWRVEVGFRGTAAASAMTDFVRAESLASDIT